MDRLPPSVCRSAPSSASTSWSSSWSAASAVSVRPRNWSSASRAASGCPQCAYQCGLSQQNTRLQQARHQLRLLEASCTHLTTMTAGTTAAPAAAQCQGRTEAAVWRARLPSAVAGAVTASSQPRWCRQLSSPTYT